MADIESLDDVLVFDHGSLIAFTPVSLAAESWVNENVETEGWQWLGRRLYVEHRAAPALIDAMLDAGLVVSIN